MTAAAAAWDTIATDLESFAQSYSAVLAELQGESWSGAASQAMAAAAVPYVQWAQTTAAGAQQVSAQARAAATAFEAAHAAITPPTVVAANRSLLLHLIATNALGQNTANIAATEAAYQRMWVHNTQTMYGYASSASSATKLPTFSQAPQTTNPAGQSAAPASAVASQAQTLTSNVLQSMTTPGSAATSTASSDWTTFLGDVGQANTLLGPVNFYSASFRSVANGVGMSVSLFRLWADGVLYAPLAGLTGATSPVGAATLPAGTLAGAAGSTGAGDNRAVLASTGSASGIGQMSVPPSWAQAVPAATVSESPLLLAGTEDLFEPDAAEAGMPGAAPGIGVGPMAAMAAAGMAMRPVVGNMLRVPPRRFKMPRHSGGG